EGGGLEEVLVARVPEPDPAVDDGLDLLGGPVRAHLAVGRAGADDAGADAGALELHLQGVDHALQAPLAGGVGRHERPGADGDVGGDEADVAAPALDHPRQEGAAQALRPDDVDVEVPGEELRVGLVDAAGGERSGVGDDDLDVAEIGGHLRAELGHGRVVGEVEGVGDRLAAGVADARGDLLEPLDPAGTERDGEARGGQRLGGGRTDARGGAGDDRGAALGLGVLVGADHQRILTVTGSEAKPRTLMEWTRRARSPATSKSRTRRTNSSSTIRASNRARLAPRQKWRPPPKETMLANSSRDRWMS